MKGTFLWFIKHGISMYFSDSSLQFVSRNLPRVFERVQIDFAFMFTDVYIYI